MGVFLAFAAVDMAGRVLTLLYQMHHSAVQRLSYRTWVLLTAFVNFAFVLYWLLGRARVQPNNAQQERAASSAQHNEPEGQSANNEQEKTK